jgi:hypothetical protein
VGYRRSPTFRHNEEEVRVESFFNHLYVIPAQAGIQQGVHIREKDSYLYILASKKYGTLYIGVTADLVARVFQHKHDLIEGFTKKFQVHMLVYYRQFEDIEA